MQETSMWHQHPWYWVLPRNADLRTSPEFSGVVTGEHFTSFPRWSRNEQCWYRNIWSPLANQHVPNTPFTQRLRPSGLTCATIKLTRSSLDAQRRPTGCHGRKRFNTGCSDITMDAMVAIKFWTCWKQSHKCCRARSLKWGRREAVALPWLQNGCTMIGQCSPSNQCVLLQKLIPQSGWCFCCPYASTAPPLCLIWSTNSVYWTITVATTVLPIGDHGNRWATMAMVLPFCAFFVRPVVPPQPVNK